MGLAEMQRRGTGGFCSCFSGVAPHVGEMSLNRSEQRVFDYLQSHPEERHYWYSKVQNVCGKAADAHAAVQRLESELWRYYEERSAVVSPFKEAARMEGLKRTSMKNLAELLMRLWLEPRAKKSSPDAHAKNSG
jgi:hypothetical protein